MRCMRQLGQSSKVCLKAGYPQERSGVQAETTIRDHRCYSIPSMDQRGAVRPGLHDWCKKHVRMMAISGDVVSG